ncbi:MAG: zinc-ribbon domain-containing protein [Clostridia bacterium]|nr:zinc-ribbon domain-containing protein [Clostridia bacterium]
MITEINNRKGENNMFCPNCGNNIPDNSQFCPRCGMQFQAKPFTQPRTRLGITVGMLGAAICFSALINPVILALLAVYVLFVEKDKWLKGIAIKVVVLYLGFFFAFEVIDGINFALGSFTNFFNYWFEMGWSMRFPAMISNIISLARMIIFIVFGFSAMNMKGISIRKIDEFVENNL